MRATFHIGHHKTGTTSLQAFLAINGPILLDAGILSPWVESQGAVWAQAQRMSGVDVAELPLELMSTNVREPHNALAFRMLSETIPGWKVPSIHPQLPSSDQMLIAISNQIDIFAPEEVIFCSEVMSHFGPSAPDLIDRLAGALEDAEFHLHVSLRRPDEQLVAWHGQRLHFGAKAKALSAPGGFDPDNLHFDYRKVVEPWLERLPDTSFALRPYRETLAAGGAIEDFFATSEIALPDGTHPVPRMNPGHPGALFGLLRAANNAGAPAVAAGLRENLHLLADGLDLPATRDIEFFGPTIRAEIVERFAPIHDWLSQTSGRAAFFEDIDDMARLRAIPEGEALRAALDAMTPERIKLLPGPRMRAFVTEMRETYRPEPQS